MNGYRKFPKAHCTHAVMTDYWNKNSIKDLKLRKELGLVK